MSEQRCDQCFNVVDITKGVKYFDEERDEMITMCSRECYQLFHDIISFDHIIDTIDRARYTIIRARYIKTECKTSMLREIATRNYKWRVDYDAETECDDSDKD